MLWLPEDGSAQIRASSQQWAWNLIAPLANQSRGEIVVVPSADCHVQSTVNTGRSISRQEGFGVARVSLSAEFTNLGNLGRFQGCPAGLRLLERLKIVAALVAGVGLQPPPPYLPRAYLLRLIGCHWIGFPCRFNLRFVPKVFHQHSKQSKSRPRQRSLLKQRRYCVVRQLGSARTRFGRQERPGTWKQGELHPIDCPPAQACSRRDDARGTVLDIIADAVFDAPEHLSNGHKTF